MSLTMFPVPKRPNYGTPAIYLDAPCCTATRKICERAFYRVIFLRQLELNIIEGFRFSSFNTYINGLNHSGY